MLANLSKAISQIGDPVLRRVALIGIAGSGLTFFLLSILVWGAFSAYVDVTNLDLWDWVAELFDWIASFVVGMSLIIVSAILFPGVATVIVGFFLEDVVAAVEAKHYPNDPPARPQPVSEVLASTGKFALMVVGLNLLCLPLYLLLMFLPPFNLVLYYLLNGYLVSREYFELVAFRRMEPAVALQMRRRSRGRILLSGILLTFLLTIPIVNFLTPVIATAFMVHVFHGLPGRQEVLPTKPQ